MAKQELERLRFERVRRRLARMLKMRSLRGIAAQIPVSHYTLARFRDGRDVRPSTLERVEGGLRRPPATPEESGKLLGRQVSRLFPEFSDDEVRVLVRQLVKKAKSRIPRPRQAKPRYRFSGHYDL